MRNPHSFNKHLEAKRNFMVASNRGINSKKRFRRQKKWGAIWRKWSRKFYSNK